MATLGIGSNAGFDVPSWQQSLSYNNQLQPTGSTETLHPGSWTVGGVKLPDFGASELVGKVLGAENPSNVIDNGPSQDEIINKYKETGWNDMNAILADIRAGGASKFTNTSPSPTGDNTTGGSGGSAPNPLLSKDYRGTNLGNSLNEPSDFWKDIYDAAQAGNQSAIDAINSQYGQNESELNRQLGMTDTYQGNDLATLLSQFNKANTETEGQRTLAKETVDTETGKAADQARMTQKQNRNVLRALGILGSTYAAENLAAPINQFDKQKAELVNWGTKRMGELENYANEKRDEYDRLTNEVKTKYGELREKIMADLRYNNKQKADALKAATAGAQQNLAQLNMQKAQYEQQIQQYSQSLTTQIAQMLMNKAPNANLNDIAKQSIAFTNQLTNTNPNVAIYQGPEKKNSLTGV